MINLPKTKNLWGLKSNLEAICWRRELNQIRTPGEERYNKGKRLLSQPKKLSKLIYHKIRPQNMIIEVEGGLYGLYILSKYFKSFGNILHFRFNKFVFI